MILVLFTLLGIAFVPVFGGRFRRLATLRLRNSWVIGAALGAQVVLLAALRSAPAWQTDTIHVASYVVAGGFVWQNRRVRGLPIAAFGGLCNFVAITANGGVMPASATAFRLIGKVVDPAEFTNSGPMAHPKLLVLGDVIPCPYPHALANVFSLGDFLLIAGVLIVIHSTCGSSLRRRTETGTASTTDSVESVDTVDTVPSVSTVPAGVRNPVVGSWAPPLPPPGSAADAPRCPSWLPIDLLPLTAPADGRVLVDA